MKVRGPLYLYDSSPVDPENQRARHFDRQFDETGERTILVLAKPDRIEPGDEGKCSGVAQIDSSMLLLSVHRKVVPYTFARSLPLSYKCLGLFLSLFGCLCINLLLDHRHKLALHRP